jgi:hypothetical protein
LTFILETRPEETDYQDIDVKKTFDIRMEKEVIKTIKERDTYVLFKKGIGPCIQFSPKDC